MYDLEKIFNTIKNGKIIPNKKIILIHGKFKKKEFENKVKEINMGMNLNIFYYDKNKISNNHDLINYDLIVVDEIYGHEKNVHKLQENNNIPIIIFTQLLPHFVEYDMINIPIVNNIVYHIRDKNDNMINVKKIDDIDYESDMYLNNIDDLTKSIILTKSNNKQDYDMIDISEKKSKDVCIQLLKIYDLQFNSSFVNYKSLEKNDKIKIYYKIIEKVENNEFDLSDIKFDHKKKFLEYFELNKEDVDFNKKIFVIPEFEIFNEMFSIEKDFINKKNRKEIIDDLNIITSEFKKKKEKDDQRKIIENYEGIKFISSTKKKEKVGDKIGFIRNKKIIIFDILGITKFSRKLKRKGWKEKEHRNKNILFLSPDYFELNLKEFKKTYSIDKIKPYQQFVFD